LPEEWIAEIENKNKVNPNYETMQSSNLMKVAYDTNEQFIPEKTFQKATETKKTMNWKR